jgi:DNA-binding transcriptional regulator YdaS (Cro superfamily)
MVTLSGIHEGGGLMETAHIGQAAINGQAIDRRAIGVRRAVTRAVAILGSEVKLAAACGVTQPAISKAKLKGRISPRLALAMDEATNGRVSASELRPDLWRRPENVPPRKKARKKE